MSQSARDALQYWEKKGLLTKKKADELRNSLNDSDDDVHHNKAISAFSAIGATLVGLGVILFVASHWSDMTPVVKVALLLIGILSTGVTGYLLAFENKSYPKTGLALLFVNLLLFGAAIFLVGQIYNLPLTFWWGALLWCSAALYFGYAFKSRMHLWLAVPLFLLFIGWLRTANVTGFSTELDFLADEKHSIITLFPLIGIGLLSASILHNRHKNLSFVAPTYSHWGLFLIVFAVVISTADRFVLFRLMYLTFDTITAVLLIASVLAVLIAVWRGKFMTKDGRAGLTALTVYTAFLYLVAALPRFLHLNIDILYSYSEMPMLTGLFVLSILLAFVFLLSVIWFGTQMKEPVVVNIGMIGVVVTVTIQYFTWAFTLLDRSLFFIVGGIIILGLSTVLERKRRQLLTAMKK